MFDKISKLQEQLDTWADSQSRRPTKAEFEANPTYGEMVKLVREEAERTFVVGGCKSFSLRRRRYCANQASMGFDYCTLHRTDSNANANKPKSQEQVNPSPDINSLADSKKTNLKRRLKRCLNPFLIPDIDGPPCWSELFKDTSRKVWLDIGCARGYYLKKVQENYECGHWNFVGVELFKPLTIAANASFQTDNLTYVHCNINKSLETLQIPNLSRISFMFPDPWSAGENATKKNLKRRVMNIAFAKRLANLMKAGSDIYFASDWHDLALDIRSCLLASGCFEIPTVGELVPTITAEAIVQLQPGQKDARLIDTITNYEKQVLVDSSELWLDSVPFDGLLTERDLVCERQWRRVYRLVLVRNQVDPYSSPPNEI